MYRVERVHRLPEALAENVVYVSDEYELAALKCACGCGHRISLLLGDGHKVDEFEGLADISPSIGVWDSPCKSHFWVRNGKVLWAEEFSDAEIGATMARQLGRHLESAARRRPWYTRVMAWLVNLIRRPS